MPRQASSTTKTVKPWAGVLGRVAHAEIKREASKKYARQAAFAQIADQSGRRLAVVLVERRVEIDRAVHALAQDQAGVRNFQGWMKFGARRRLHAMIRPQHLRAVGRGDGVEGRRRDARMQRRDGRAGANPGSAPRAEPRRETVDVGTISSPRGTASAPPGQKSFCTSTTIRTSDAERAVIGSWCLRPAGGGRLPRRAQPGRRQPPPDRSCRLLAGARVLASVPARVRTLTDVIERGAGCKRRPPRITVASNGSPAFA